jgi:hypothetical protein
MAAGAAHPARRRSAERPISNGGGDGQVIEPGARQQLQRASVEARMP